LTPVRKPAAANRHGSRSRREFYSIGEVCNMFDVKPHVLRYWETQFERLAPAKNRAGNRVYRSEDVEFVGLVRQLVHEERYTIEGARQRLAELDAEPDADANSTLQDRAFLNSLRRGLEEVRQLLTHSAR
jgi:DNA-binding transcriptional MerR regulator